MDGPRQIGGALHQVVVLGARPGDAGGVAFLEGVVADQVRRHLTAEDDQRNAVHQRIGDAGDGVGGAGTGGDDDHPDLAGRARVALGGVHGAALLPHQDVTDLVLLEQLVVDGENGASGVSEYIHDALVDERLDEDLRTGHLFVRHRKLLLGLIGGRPGERGRHRQRKAPGGRGQPVRRQPSHSGATGQYSTANKRNEFRPDPFRILLIHHKICAELVS